MPADSTLATRSPWAISAYPQGQLSATVEGYGRIVQHVCYVAMVMATFTLRFPEYQFWTANPDRAAQRSYLNGAITRRPASVICIQGARCPFVRTRSIDGVASPTRTRLFSISAENPLTISAVSALPLSPASASISSARRHWGLRGISGFPQAPLGAPTSRSRLDRLNTIWRQPYVQNCSQYYKGQR